MGNNIKKTEGGNGGKKGHSNMAHWSKTEVIKQEAKKSRRENDKKEVKDFKDLLESLQGIEQKDLLEAFKEGYKVMFEDEEMPQSPAVKPAKPFWIFDINNVKEAAELLKTRINAPYVSASISTLGGKERVSILFTVAIDPRETWANGILENSRYMKFDLENNGVLEHFSGNFGNGIKFRKCRLKSIDDVINKLNDFISKTNTK